MGSDGVYKVHDHLVPSELGLIPMSWEVTELQNLIHLDKGLSYKSKHFDPNGIPMMNLKCIARNGGLQHRGIKYYAGAYKPHHVVEPGDIVIAMTDLTQDRVVLASPAIVPHVPDEPKIIMSLDLCCPRIPPKSVLSKKWLYYRLQTRDFKVFARGFANGTTVMHLKMDGIKQYRFALPPLAEQRRIAAVLGALDDKIELNRKMNQTLEEMAQALFKSRFIDFDGTDDLVPSELGPIPRGWRVSPIDDIIEIIGGGTPKRKMDEYWNGTIPWYSVRDAPSDRDIYVLDTSEHITKAGESNSSARVVPAWTTIISARGTVGKLAVTSRPMAFNQSCYGIQSRNGHGKMFTYFALRNVVAALQRSAHGSVFDTITRNTFKMALTIVPPLSMAQAFETNVVPLLDRILNNATESRTLAQLRDTLLPKLISGEIRVPEAEQQLEAVL